MPELFVAQGEDDIRQAVEDIGSGKHPGFLTDPGIDFATVLTVTEDAMRQFYGDFIFNVGKPLGRMPDTGEHIDEIEAAMRAGAAAHHNHKGRGEVRMRFARPGITMGMVPPLRFLNRFIADGPMFTGKLHDGTNSVFSEGIRVPEMNILVGAALHDYISAPRTRREWENRTWDPTLVAPVSIPGK
jgi:hypothetical protein